MTNQKITLILMSFLFLIFLSNCALISSASNIRVASKWTDVKNSEDFQREKKILSERIGGKVFCSKTGVAELIEDLNETPSKNCLYTSASLIVTDPGLLDTRSLKVKSKDLRVFQVVPDGFIVDATDWATGGRTQRVAFIWQTDQVGMIDGSFLDNPFAWDLYEYTGVYQYRTTMGAVKTVYAFKKVTKEIAEQEKDLKTYRIFKEFLIDNKLWYLL